MAMQDDIPTVLPTYGELFPNGESGNDIPSVRSSFENPAFPPDALARQRMLAAVVGRENPIGYGWGVGNPATP